jgi:hypothetical protein
LIDATSLEDAAMTRRKRSKKSAAAQRKSAGRSEFFVYAASGKAVAVTEERMRYLGGVPKRVAEGRVLHHNHVRHTVDMPPGLNGFRAWTAARPLSGFKRCGCGWSGLPHYSRMSRGYKCESANALELTRGHFDLASLR